MTDNIPPNKVPATYIQALLTAIFQLAPCSDSLPQRRNQDWPQLTSYFLFVLNDRVQHILHLGNGGLLNLSLQISDIA